MYIYYTCCDARQYERPSTTPAVFFGDTKYISATHDEGYKTSPSTGSSFTSQAWVADEFLHLVSNSDGVDSARDCRPLPVLARAARRLFLCPQLVWGARLTLTILGKVLWGLQSLPLLTHSALDNGLEPQCEMYSHKGIADIKKRRISVKDVRRDAYSTQKEYEPQQKDPTESITAAWDQNTGMIVPPEPRGEVVYPSISYTPEDDEPILEARSGSVSDVQLDLSSTSLVSGSQIDRVDEQSASVSDDDNDYAQDYSGG
ncbi:hypothetical protein IW262DRAFT_1297761 [Armillaria fumosa]|nr:hypothetical protein IW262DRAFT_1297761 [Armillaria fumosa]